MAQSLPWEVQIKEQTEDVLGKVIEQVQTNTEAIQAQDDHKEAALETVRAIAEEAGRYHKEVMESIPPLHSSLQIQQKQIDAISQNYVGGDYVDHKVDQLNERIKRVSSHTSTVSNNFASQIENLQEKVEILEDQPSISSKIVDVEATAKSLKEDVVSLAESVLDLNKKNQESANKAIEEVNEAVKLTSEALGQATKLAMANEETLTILNTEISTLTGAVDTCKEMKQELKTLKEAVGNPSVDEDLSAAIEDKLKLAENKVGTTFDKLGEILTVKFGEIQKNTDGCEVLTSTVAYIEQSIDTLEKSVAAANARITAAVDQADEDSQDFQELKGNFSNVEDSLQTIHQEILDVQVKTKENFNDLESRLEKSFEQVQKDKEALEKKLSDSEDVNREADKAMNQRLTDEKTLANNFAEDTNGQLQKIQTKLENHQGICKSQQERIESVFTIFDGNLTIKAKTIEVEDSDTGEIVDIEDITLRLGERLSKLEEMYLSPSALRVRDLKGKETAIPRDGIVEVQCVAKVKKRRTTTSETKSTINAFLLAILLTVGGAYGAMAYLGASVVATSVASGLFWLFAARNWIFEVDKTVEVKYWKVIVTLINKKKRTFKVSNEDIEGVLIASGYGDPDEFIMKQLENI